MTSAAQACTWSVIRTPCEAPLRAIHRTSTPAGAVTGSRSASVGTSMKTCPTVATSSASRMAQIAGAAVSSPASRIRVALPRRELGGAARQLGGRGRHGRTDDAELVPDTARRHPPRGRSGVPVRHEVDVELAGVRTEGPDGVGAQRVPLGVGQCAPRAVPVVTVGQVGEPVSGDRQDDLDPLVEPDRGEVRERVTGERHPDERRVSADTAATRTEKTRYRAATRYEYGMPYLRLPGCNGVPDGVRGSDPCTNPTTNSRTWPRWRLRAA